MEGEVNTTWKPFEPFAFWPITFWENNLPRSQYAKKQMSVPNIYVLKRSILPEHFFPSFTLITFPERNSTLEIRNLSYIDKIEELTCGVACLLIAGKVLLAPGNCQQWTSIIYRQVQLVKTASTSTKALFWIAWNYCQLSSLHNMELEKLTKKRKKKQHTKRPFYCKYTQDTPNIPSIEEIHVFAQFSFSNFSYFGENTTNKCTKF